MIRPRLLAVALAALLAGGLPAAASAAQLQLFAVDSFSGGSTQMSFASFDPALGTLDRVDVSISGTLVVQGPTLISVIPTPGGPVPLPVPLTAIANQDFFRIGIGSRGFEFATAAQFILTGIASGLGETTSLTRPFSYDFAFTDITDLIGFVFPAFSGATIPPVSIIGRRNDFLDLAQPLPDLPIDIVTQTQLGSAIGFLSATAEAIGSVRITYIYTPAPVVVAVAEPATLALLGAGLFALAWRHRRG